MNVNVTAREDESLIFAKAMADETRQRVMSLLCCRWQCVGDIVDELGGVGQPTVSHHLAVLREAGLVHVRREGKQVFYSLDQDKVAVCCGLIMRVFAPELVDVARVDVGLDEVTVSPG